MTLRSKRLLRRFKCFFKLVVGVIFGVIMFLICLTADIYHFPLERYGYWTSLLIAIFVSSDLIWEKFDPERTTRRWRRQAERNIRQQRKEMSRFWWGRRFK